MNTSKYMLVARFILSIITTIALVSGLTINVTTAFAQNPVSSDNFADAISINALPFSDWQDTTVATTEVSDPVLPCGPGDQGAGSVWYRYDATADGLLTLDTAGSDYYDVIAVWTGIPDALSNKACTNNGSTGVQTRALVTSGETYYIEVVGDGESGALIFNADFKATTSFTWCSAVTEVPQVECEALVALYDATDGANWTNKFGGWKTINTPCDWQGVTCSGGSVTELVLTQNNLAGPIPPKLDDLTYLQRLRLDFNQLTGDIPADLGNLTNLTELGLYENQLSGSIPPELGGLAYLTSLILSGNQLSGSIPSELTDLTKLQQLSLSYNQLTGNIPSGLGNLTSLRGLSLSYNQLTGSIPYQLGDLAYLTTLNLSNNQLSGSIPPEVVNLTSLAQLRLRNNQFSGSLPGDIGHLTKLKGLSTDNNQLTGEIPPSITNLTNLTFLTLSCGLTTSDLNVVIFLNEKSPGWYTSCPSFSIQTDINWVSPNSSWSPGMSVTFTVDDDSDPNNGYLYQTVQTPDDNSQISKWQSDINIMPGQYVSMDDGSGEYKSIYIPEVYFDSVDQTNDIASGRGPANSIAKVNIQTVEGDASVFIKIGADGNWQANFHDMGFSIQNILWANIEVFDSDWDSVSIDQRTISVTMPPYFSGVSGQGSWSEIPGTTFTLKVYIDPPTPQDPEPDYERVQDYPEFNLFDFRIHPGFTVSLTEEMTGGIKTEKKMVVSDLEIQSVDFLNGTVSGATQSSMPLTIKTWCDGTRYTRDIPQPSGTWTVDFPPGFLTYGCRIDAVQNYPDGSSSIYSWPYRSPFSQADPMNDAVSAERWPPGTYLTMTIDDASNGDGIDYTVGPVIMGELGLGCQPWNTCLQFDLGDYDLEAGDTIQVQGGTDPDHLNMHQIEYTVDNVEITDVKVNPDNVVYGKANKDDQVTVYASNDDFKTYGVRRAVVGEDGIWSVNFSIPVPGGSYEEQIIVPLTSESKINADVNTNTTGVEWPTQKTRTIGTAGGVIFTPNVKMQIPAGALSEPVEFNILEGGSGYKINTDQGEMETVFSATISPNGTNFNYPVSLKLLWQDADGDGLVDNSNIRETDLYLSMDGSIIAGPCSTDPACDLSGNFITVLITNLADFAVGKLSNQPPTITAITAPVAPVQLRQSINATVEFADHDTGDTHIVTWDWGDGSTTTAPASVPSVTTAHTYTSTGVYTVTATITDAADASVTATYQYVVIYDPNGGFVTGGGWINSPAGAYTTDPTLTGKATFGFVSKYQKGANVPTGDTEFQFKVANLNFKSTSYDWLVIAGMKAQYKGTGTINGVGNYGFMLTAIDGTLDKFRIKIWDKATENIIYDNQLGVTDSADPTTVLGGGSIVIHKEK